MFDFLKDFGAKSGQTFQSVSTFHEDAAYGTDSVKVQESLAKDVGIKVLEKIAYMAQTTSLTSEVQRLKAANAGLDAILLHIRHLPAAAHGQGARLQSEADRRTECGLHRPDLIATMGKDAEGSITRSPYNSDLEGRIPLVSKVNAIFETFKRPRSLGRCGARLHGRHDASGTRRPASAPGC